jgi:ABC-type glycerol-3-phosphate transport system substrate-binding protein
VAAFDSAEAAAAIQLWADLVAEGLALNVPTADQSEQAFLSQGVAVCIATTSVMGSFREQATFDLKAATFPAFGEKGLRLPSGGNSLFVLASDDGKREAAWRFVEHMESPENLSLFCLATGYLPARNGVALPQDALRDVAVGQREYVVPFVSFPGPNGFQAAQVLSDGVMQALGGRSRAEDVLVEAADEVDGLIDGRPCLS